MAKAEPMAGSVAMSMHGHYIARACIREGEPGCRSVRDTVRPNLHATQRVASRSGWKCHLSTSVGLRDGERYDRARQRSSLRSRERASDRGGSSSRRLLLGSRGDSPQRTGSNRHGRRVYRRPGGEPHLRGHARQQVGSRRSNSGDVRSLDRQLRGSAEQWFFKLHDPTTLNRQGNDIGTQYRSAIFPQTPEQKSTAERVKARVEASGRWKKPITTSIEPASTWYSAESYHQDYLRKNPGGYSCHFMRD
jgi:hypothetical protein